MLTDLCTWILGYTQNSFMYLCYLIFLILDAPDGMIRTRGRVGKQLDAASIYAFNFLLKYSRDLYKLFINIIEMFLEKWEHLLIRTH